MIELPNELQKDHNRALRYDRIRSIARQLDWLNRFVY